MKQLFMGLVVFACAAGPLSAEEDAPASPMERGMQQFLDGLLGEMEPAFDSMRGFMQQMGPAMMDLMEQIEDWSAYEAPEVLPNGDIIIRRKPEKTPPEEVQPQIDL